MLIYLKRPHRRIAGIQISDVPGNGQFFADQVASLKASALSDSRWKQYEDLDYANWQEWGVPVPEAFDPPGLTLDIAGGSQALVDQYKYLFGMWEQTKNPADEDPPFVPSPLELLTPYNSSGNTDEAYGPAWYTVTRTNDFGQPTVIGADYIGVDSAQGEAEVEFEASLDGSQFGYSNNQLTYVCVRRFWVYVTVDIPPGGIIPIIATFLLSASAILRTSDFPVKGTLGS